MRAPSHFECYANAAVQSDTCRVANFLLLDGVTRADSEQYQPTYRQAETRTKPVCGELLIFDTIQQFATHRHKVGLELRVCKPPGVGGTVNQN